MSNSEGYKVVKATKDDIEKLNEFVLNIFLEQPESISKEEKLKIISYIKNDINANLENYKVIYIDNIRIGCVKVKFEEDRVLIDKIYLVSEHRNKGIGTDILKNILNKYKIVYLWVYKSNKKAISLYLKLKFKIVDETETRYYMKYEN